MVTVPAAASPGVPLRTRRGAQGKTWILVAARTRARLFEARDAKSPLMELAVFVDPEGREPAGSRGNLRPTRNLEGASGIRYAVEPRTLPEAKHAERFARRLQDALAEGRVQRRYQRLVLAAAPRFLGVLRATLDKHVRECVVLEVKRDLTTMDPAQIRLRVFARDRG